MQCAPTSEPDLSACYAQAGTEIAKNICNGKGREGFMRFIVFAILGYILFRLTKGLLYSSQKKYTDNISADENEMIKDPYCHVYIAKRDAYPAKLKGEALYFCSEECLERYKKERI